MYRRILIVALFALLAACGSDAADEGSGATAAPDGETARALEAELIAADRRFAATVARHGLGGWMESFAPTGRLVVGGQSYVGPEGIRRAVLPLFADSTFSLTWDPTYAEVAASGDLGYTVGRYESTAVVDGETVVDSGTYLTVWRRQPGGAWKVQADIGNPDAGGPTAP